MPGNTLDFSSTLDVYRAAARDAFRTVGEAAGVPVLSKRDRLKALRNMSEDDLDALSEEYGVDQVMHYIARLAGG